MGMATIITTPTTVAKIISSEMPTDQKQASFPRSRESVTPGRESADSCMGLHPGGEDIKVADNDINPFQLARLMIWLSPAYPVGAYSYSHGLEWVVETGRVKNVETLVGWIEDLLVHGAGRSDAIFLAETWRAFSAGDMRLVEDVAELAAAFAPTSERRLETLAQGTAFLTATLAAWSKPQLEALAANGREVAYPVAVGASAAVHGLPLAETTQAYAQAFASNVVSAAVRLIPLGQSDGLRALARLEPLIPRVVAAALACTLDDVGGAAIAADIASMRHETQYTRLFRS
jgi:urease accessory protein